MLFFLGFFGDFFAPPFRAFGAWAVLFVDFIFWASWIVLVTCSFEVWLLSVGTCDFSGFWFLLVDVFYGVSGLIRWSTWRRFDLWCLVEPGLAWCCPLWCCFCFVLESFGIRIWNYFLLILMVGWNFSY